MFHFQKSKFNSMREEFSGREDSLAGFVWHRLMIQWNLLMIRLKIVLKLGEKNLNRLLLILSRSKSLKPVCIKFTSIITFHREIIVNNADYTNYLTSAGYTYNQFAHNIRHVKASYPAHPRRLVRVSLSAFIYHANFIRNSGILEP